MRNPLPVPRKKEDRAQMREFWFTSDNKHLHGIGCFAEDKILVSRTFMADFLQDVEKEKEARDKEMDRLDLNGKPLKGRDLKVKKLEQFIVDRVLMAERQTADAKNLKRAKDARAELRNFIQNARLPDEIKQKIARV